MSLNDPEQKPNVVKDLAKAKAKKKAQTKVAKEQTDPAAATPPNDSASPTEKQTMLIGAPQPWPFPVAGSQS